MRTYQDFTAAGDKAAFLLALVGEHKASEAYSIAKDADEYDAQRNITIRNYAKLIYTLSGSKVNDFTATNAKLCSNFFASMNTQRCNYLLGNGISFTDERIKERLGGEFDNVLKDAAYYALIHGVSFVFWNYDRAHYFKLTELIPLWDEESGALRAGVRFWQIASTKPMLITLYEESGYTRYRVDKGNITEIAPLRGYKQIVQRSKAAGEVIVSEESYSTLPIVPLWGQRIHQSTLVGLREQIDSYDLIRSGFANDLADCTEIYTLIENYGGMTDEDIERFRDRLKLLHIASVDTSNGGRVSTHTAEIPVTARKEYLAMLRAGIYEDFGALDVHTVAAGATNDHIDAAYQALDDKADDFEYQIIKCVMQLLALIGVTGTDAVPLFKRNRISNVKEQVETIMLEAPYLDDETILKKLPNITPEEVASVLERRAADGMARFEGSGGEAE